MAAQLFIYQSAEEYVFDGTIHLWEDQFKLMLVGPSYTPNVNTHTVKADVTGEVAATGGYTAGGWVLDPIDISRAGATTTVDVANLVKTAVAGTIPAWRYAVIYANVTRNTVVDPLLYYVLGNDAAGGTDIPATLVDTNLVFNWNPLGIWTS